MLFRSDPKAALYTLKNSLTKALGSWVRDITSELERSAATPEEKSEVLEFKSKLQRVAMKTASSMVDNLEGAMSSRGMTTANWQGISPARIPDENYLKAIMAARPGIARQIAEQFGSAEAAMRAEGYIVGDEGQYFELGKPYIPEGPGSRWGRNVGGLLYGAYIARRMLAMTAGPSVQEAEYYSSKVLEPAISTSAILGGAPMASTYEGVAARASVFRDIMARGAYEQWGGVGDLGLVLTGGALPRLMSGVGTGLGIAGVGALLPRLVEMGGLTSLGGMASMLSGPIQVAGLAVAGATVGMEIYNAFNPGELVTVTATYNAPLLLPLGTRTSVTVVGSATFESHAPAP